MGVINYTSDESKTLFWGRGDTKRKVVTFKNAAGAALDVSGSSFVMSVDSLMNPPDATTLLFAISGIFVTDGTDGQVYFAPGVGDTDLPPSGYFYDMQEIDGNAEIATLFKARIEIEQDITK